MNPFWKTWPGIATLTGIGATAAAALAYAVSKTTSSSTKTTTGLYYLFGVTAPALTASSPTIAAAAGTVAAVLAANGFSNIQIAFDPTTTVSGVSSGWLVTASLAGATPPMLPASSGMTITYLSVLAAGQAPPAPMTYGGLVVGNWYAFTIATTYTSTAANALGNTMNVLSAAGWEANMMVAPSSSNNTKWNVAAQWGGPGTTATDGLPLFVYAPPVGSATTNATPVLLPGEPSSVSTV